MYFIICLTGHVQLMLKQFGNTALLQFYSNDMEIENSFRMRFRFIFLNLIAEECFLIYEKEIKKLV